MAKIRGRKQSEQHIQKRIQRGENHYRWQGDQISQPGGRSRAERMYPNPGPCVVCGNKGERHHIDGNTANNLPENVRILCRHCHMEEDGRLVLLAKGPRNNGSGSTSHNHKLSVEQVHEIRELIAQGFNNKQIGDKYNVSSSAISRIRSGKTWNQE